MVDEGYEYFQAAICQHLDIPRIDRSRYIMLI